MAIKVLKPGLATTVQDLGRPGYYDIGIAVGSPRGLVVPIIRDADQLSFAEIEKIQQETDKKMSGAGGAIKAELDRLNKEAPDLHAGMRDMVKEYEAKFGAILEDETT